MTEQTIPAAALPSADLIFALELAELADSIALPRFRAADLAIDEKPDRTFVTDADLRRRESVARQDRG